MPNTPKYALPYPPPTGVSPDVPYYMQQLAEGVEAQLDYARDPHHAIIRPNVTQSVPNATGTRMVTNVTTSVESMTVNHAAGSVTTTRAGLYLVAAAVGWAANGTGYRAVILNQGAVNIGTQAAQAFTPGGNFEQVTALVRAAIGDVFTVDLYQSSGGALSTFGFADRTFLSVARLGD